MCTVVGYVGKSYSRSYIIDGLSRLEYRGYDSAGFACLNPQNNQLIYAKSQGGVSNLVKKIEEAPIDGFVGIGHTRWSTHGVSSHDNAHPHFDCHKTLSLVHNGIIENYTELKEKLVEAGHNFVSQTDTEVIAHLFEALILSHISFKPALIELVNKLHGAYAFICLAQDIPDTIIAVRKRSPLCIGIGDGEMFVASDPLAFVGRTKKVLFLPDESFALVRNDGIELYDFSGVALPLTIQEVDHTWSHEGKQGYEHFMLKEIYEQKRVIHDTVFFLQSLSPRIWEHIGIDADFIKTMNSVNLIGCGSSWHAGRIAQFFFEKLCMVPAQVHIASEFRHAPFFADSKSLYIAVSQSGETADTLEAARIIGALGMKTLALTNVPSSTMVREATGFLLTQARQEVAVASTKSFTAQLAALYWFAHRVALHKELITQQQLELAEKDLLVVAEVLENSIENYKFDIMTKHAPRYAQHTKFVFIGRHITYPFALEAALKLKEIAYIFVDCYAAGELKHGALALIDTETPVVVFSVTDPLVYQKLLANAQEVKARSGHLIVFAFEGQTELINLADTVFVFPRVNPLLAPLAMVGLMQFFAYKIAQELDRPIDKPRNLAKSVTVE